MDKKKLVKQLAVIAFVIIIFAGLDLGIYHFFIKRVISHHSPGMQKMSVEVSVCKACCFIFENCGVENSNKI